MIGVTGFGVSSSTWCVFQLRCISALQGKIPTAQNKVSSATRGNGSGTAFRGSDLYINYKVCQFQTPIYMELVRSSSGTCIACRNHPENLRGCFKPWCVKGPKPGFNGLVRLKRTITVIWFCFLCNTAEELHPLISASKP